MKTSATHGDPSHQAIIDRLEAVIRENGRDLIGHFQAGQKKQDDRMGNIEKDISTLKVDMQAVKQDISLMKNAIVELANNEHHLRNLVRHLQREGIKITEAEVFAA